MSSLQTTAIQGRPSWYAMYPTKRDLPQPVGPLNITGLRALSAVSMQIKELEYNIGLPSPAEDFEDFALSEGRKLIPTFNATGTKASDPD